MRPPWMMEAMIASFVRTYYFAASTVGLEQYKLAQK